MNRIKQSVKFLMKKDFRLDIDSEEIDSSLTVGENYKLLKSKYINLDYNVEDY